MPYRLTLLLLAVCALGLWAQNQGYVSPDEKLPLDPPEQPLPYSHKLHVGQLKLECKQCHQEDEDGFLMSFPATETCMACHQAIKTESPDIQKLAAFAEKGEKVPWVQIYRVPDFVWFAHASHTEVGVECGVCHGPVAERTQMFKEKPTNMVSCMKCHAEHGAPNDCDLCHDPG